ncbi:phytanoyl-CoA dioxygenase family protein [Cerasicoccus arenae]|nr:phytanoyl-CoA dioxygenase family protein [Cerasicoccus arenae]MBK1858779.1 phytanoyl-CoA dioxygenase family protein [Cerasicoccus arenae]
MNITAPPPFTTKTMQTPARSLDEKLSWTAHQATAKPLQFALTADELTRYHEQGFLVKRGLVADFAETMQTQADALLAMEELQVDGNLRLDLTRDARIWKIDPFADLHPFWSRLTRDRRIADVLATIYEGREPRLLKDKLIYKPPHSQGNALHQDYTWWQGLPTSAISVCIAIDYTTIANGATTLYPGLHKNGLINAPGELSFLDRKVVDGVEPEVVCAEPGDVIFFDCFTPHEAGPNTTDGFRRQIFLSYNDSADGEWHAAHYDHFFSYRIKGASEEDKVKKFFL